MVGGVDLVVLQGLGDLVGQLGLAILAARQFLVDPEFLGPLELNVDESVG